MTSLSTFNYMSIRPGDTVRLNQYIVHRKATQENICTVIYLSCLMIICDVNNRNYRLFL